MAHIHRVLILVLMVPCVAQATSIAQGLEGNLAKSAAVLSILHKKAKKALVNVAQDKTFSAYFSTQDAQHKHQLKEQIDHISLNVQDNFHVEEMCLIDPNGLEISRIVGSQIGHDLSNEEASAPFFAPGFRHRPRSVYVSPMYMSPDADKWVVAYVTPITLDGEKRAILHYEHGLDVYQRVLAKVAGADNAIQLAVTEDGWIVWDKARPIDVNKKGQSEEPSTYFDQFQFGGKSVEQLVDAFESHDPILGDDGQVYIGTYAKVGDWFLITIQQAQFDPLSLN